MKAEVMFREYHNMKKELSILTFQMKQFEGINDEDVIASMYYSNPQGERVQTSNISDKTSKVALNFRQVANRMNNEWFEFILNRYKAIVEELDFFEYSIGQLNGNLPFIISDMIVGQLSWDELSGKYHIGHSTIGKYRKKAIAELDYAYEIRERQVEAYILS